MSAKTFLVMAGGTGGHVYPALGFAELAREQGHSVSWLGTANGIEARIVPARNIELNLIDIQGVRGKGFKALLAAPFKIFNALVQARRVLKRINPDLVIGFGGYSAGPGGLAAKISGVPLVIHEQNAVAGTTNRLLGKIANKCLSAFEGALPKSETVGNPVRAEILAVEPKQAEASSDVRVLVVGGSLGARFLNQTVPQAIASLAVSERPIIRHQAGPKLLQEAIESYRESGVEADISAYIEDMAAAYQWADLVVCRAGAMTVSELSIVGVASMLVPFPFAIDDHQTANAQWLVDADASLIYQQSENSIDEFTRRLVSLVRDKKRLAQMARNARACGLRDSAQRILAICEQLISAGAAHVA